MDLPPGKSSPSNGFTGSEADPPGRTPLPALRMAPRSETSAVRAGLAMRLTGMWEAAEPCLSITWCVSVVCWLLAAGGELFSLIIVDRREHKGSRRRVQTSQLPSSSLSVLCELRPSVVPADSKSPSPSDRNIPCPIGPLSLFCGTTRRDRLTPRAPCLAPLSSHQLPRNSYDTRRYLSPIDTASRLELLIRVCLLSAICITLQLPTQLDPSFPRPPS